MVLFLILYLGAGFVTTLVANAHHPTPVWYGTYVFLLWPITWAAALGTALR